MMASTSFFHTDKAETALSPPVNFDTAAAGRPLPQLVQWYAELLPLYSINPHGGTCYAERSRRLVIDAERRLMALLGISEGSADVIWTSGVTEALNLAATALRGKNVLLDPGAHEALSKPLSNAICIPFQIDGNGRLYSDNHCGNAALSHINNETGVEQDLAQIRHEIGDGIVLVDAAQSFCRVRIPWNEAGIDMLAISSRKIGGPASVGALVCRRGRTELKPLILGGGQQRGVRSGTVDVCGIEMFVRSAESLYAAMAEGTARIKALNAEFRSCLEAFRWRHEVVCGDGERHIHLLHLPGYEGAVLSRILADNHGIMVASSSACSAEHGGGSTTMRALGYSEQAAKEAIRISFDANSTTDDIHFLFDALDRTLEDF